MQNAADICPPSVCSKHSESTATVPNILSPKKLFMQPPIHAGGDGSECLPQFTSPPLKTPLFRSTPRVQKQSSSSLLETNNSRSFPAAESNISARKSTAFTSSSVPLCGDSFFELNRSVNQPSFSSAGNAQPPAFRLPTKSPSNLPALIPFNPAASARNAEIEPPSIEIVDYDEDLIPWEKATSHGTGNTGRLSEPGPRATQPISKCGGKVGQYEQRGKVHHF